MLVEDWKKKKKARAIGDIVAFQWLPTKYVGRILLPSTIYKGNLRTSKICYGQILSIGTKVKSLHEGDFFIFREYDALNLFGELKEDEVYFIPSKMILATVDKPKGLIERKEPTYLDSEANEDVEAGRT